MRNMFITLIIHYVRYWTLFITSIKQYKALTLSTLQYFSVALNAMSAICQTLQMKEIYVDKQYECC